jgi:hypothetical protein
MSFRFLNSRTVIIALVVLSVVVGGAVWLRAQGGPQASIGPLSSTPPNIIYNTPTKVTFTVRIDTPTVNPTTVELQKVSSTNQLISTVGRMYDNGQGGDPVADDRNFTAVITLNEPAVGKSYFRVAAAFRGNKQNAWSISLGLDIDPFKLPPDPGEAGKLTLEGIDSDKDGIRDDVQRWIGLNFPMQSSVRSALAQYVRANQDFITSTNDDTLVSIVERRHKAQNCLRFVNGNDIDRATDQRSILRSILLNTPERTRLYFRADSKLVGISIPGTDQNSWGTDCQ